MEGQRRTYCSGLKSGGRYFAGRLGVVLLLYHRLLHPSPWGWLYTYSSSQGTQTWCNSAAGSSGDIVTNSTGFGVPEFGVPAILVASLSLLGLMALRKHEFARLSL
ncbi:MAG: hypothetical protein JRN52_00675 [Nitrososphaerota archaeon]|nr:hypothetical protein [Nitrososphaerota archaeon]